MSGIINQIWHKSPGPGHGPKSVNGDKESRGTKRKAKGDPYEDIDDGKIIAYLGELHPVFYEPYAPSSHLLLTRPNRRPDPQNDAFDPTRPIAHFL